MIIQVFTSTESFVGVRDTLGSKKLQYIIYSVANMRAAKHAANLGKRVLRQKLEFNKKCKKKQKCLKVK